MFFTLCVPLALFVLLGFLGAFVSQYLLCAFGPLFLASAFFARTIRCPKCRKRIVKAGVRYAGPKPSPLRFWTTTMCSNCFTRL